MVKLIEDYLKDLTPYDIPEGAIENILIDAKVPKGMWVTRLSVKQLDICKAYTYLWCASIPSTTGSVEDSDGGWVHKEGSKQVSAYDKDRLRKMGLNLLSKYGLNPEKSTIHIVSGGIRVFSRHR